MRHMARFRTFVLRYRKQRRAENYLDVCNNQSFCIRDRGLPLQSEGKARHFELSGNACISNERD